MTLRATPAVSASDPDALDHLDTIPALLAARAALQGTDEALVIGERRLSWAALAAATGRVAGGLQALGIGPGDHLGVCAGNSVEWVLAWFAAAHLGATIVPLNTRWKDDELVWAIGHADCKLVVFGARVLTADLTSLIGRARLRLPGVTDWFMAGPGPVPDWARPFDQLDGPAPPVAARPDGLTLIQFTSGSTARPKGVMLSQAGMLANARGSAGALGLRRTDRYFSPRPFFHVAGSTGGILRALVTGACLISIAAFDENLAIATLRVEGCDLVSGNDTMFLKLIASLGEGEAHGLRLRGGQAAAGPEVQRQIHERLGVTGLCCSYGLSEASPGVAFARWNDPLDERIAGLMWPLPGVALRIRDPDSGRLLPAGQAGEVLVRGPSVMLGYYKQPEATHAALDTEGWLATGDLGVLADDGRLRFIGRLKDVIRVGGENLAPAEVEDVLQRHPAVAAAQVVAVPDARLGEVPVAWVVPRAGMALSPDALIEWVRPRLAGFKVPRHVGMVTSFDDVTTGSGKVQKNLLRERAVRAFVGPGATPA